MHGKLIRAADTGMCDIKDNFLGFKCSSQLVVLDLARAGPLKET